MQEKISELRFAFFGTPDVASKTLEILKQAGYLPALIITAPDVRAGRGMHLQESPVAIFARENKIECLKPEKLDEEFTLKLSTFNFQLSIVVAYGKIIPENILNIPKLGSINIHYSLLPKYRGASPVESAILNGETKTGVSIQKMVYKMDAGPVIAREETEIGPAETAPALRERLIEIGGKLLIKLLTPSASGTSPLAGGELIGEEQDETQATFVKKIKKEGGLLDLNDDPAKNYNKFRAFAAWPRTYFFRDGKRYIITQAKLENGKFIIERIIPEGGKEQNYRP